VFSCFIAQALILTPTVRLHMFVCTIASL